VLKSLKESFLSYILGVISVAEQLPSQVENSVAVALHQLGKRFQISGSAASEQLAFASLAKQGCST
jgi:hypothetical protein